MINMIIRYFNQNRKKILLFILVIASIIVLIQLLNNITKKQNESKYNNNTKINSINNQIRYDNEQKTTTNNQINDKNIDIKEDLKYNAINQFIKYCNQKNINEAYNMISDTCKNNLFPQISNFKENYLDIAFSEEKTVSIEKSYYGDNIYKVIFNNNLLSSGGNKSSNMMQDYIYVEEQDNNVYKLNLNRFLDDIILNAKDEKNNISVNIYRRIRYINHEEYQIQIINNNDDNIQISDGNIYLLDTNNKQYSANINKIIVGAKKSYNLNITFYKECNVRKSKSIIFKEIKLDSEQEKEKIITVDVEL